MNLSISDRDRYHSGIVCKNMDDFIDMIFHLSIQNGLRTPWVGPETP